MKRAVLTPDLLSQLRAMTRESRRDIGRAITELERTFGQLHRHAGLGIRPLRGDYFEIRLRLRNRLVFKNLPEGLVCEFIGDHDAVRRFLKSR